MSLAGIIVAALTAFLGKAAEYVVKLIIFVGLMLVLTPLLPADPLQPYIMQFAAAIRPYTELLNYFVPVGYCFFAFAFFIAWKYVIKPFRAFFLSSGLFASGTNSNDILGR